MTLQTVWHLTLYGYAILVALFGAYIVVMSLKGAHKRKGHLHPLEWALGIPWIVGGHILDFTANVLLSLYFLDLPREPLLTARLKRYKENHSWDGSRNQRIAYVWCKILSTYDPDGAHC